MSWTVRNQQRRRLQQTWDNIEVGIGYLKDFHDRYKKDHDELARMAMSIASVMGTIQEHLMQLRDNV